MADDIGVWIYAVADAMSPEWLSGTTGVAGEPVRVITASGLAAAVSTVNLAEFGEQALRRHLENLGWLEATARAHHEVIDIVARHVPALPMRLATVCHGDTRVAAMLAQRQAEFTAALRRVTGRVEWGVKVSAAPSGADPDDGSSEPAGGGPGGGPGAAFLRRRRSQLAASEKSRRAAAASAEQIHLALGGLATVSCLRPPQSPQLTGQPERMILNGAYLVDEDRAAEFADAVQRLAGQHPRVQIDLTGPWPPYSFAFAGERDAAPGEEAADTGEAAG